MKKLNQTEERFFLRWTVCELVTFLFCLTLFGLWCFHNQDEFLLEAHKIISSQLVKTQIDIREAEALYSQRVTTLLLSGLVVLLCGSLLLSHWLHIKKFRLVSLSLFPKVPKLMELILGIIILCMLLFGAILFIQTLTWLMGISSIPTGIFPELEKIENLLLEKGIPLSALKVHLTITLKEIAFSFLIGCVAAAFLGCLVDLPVYKRGYSLREFLIYGYLLFRSREGRK